MVICDSNLCTNVSSGMEHNSKKHERVVGWGRGVGGCYAVPHPSEGAARDLSYRILI